MRVSLSQARDMPSFLSREALNNKYRADLGDIRRMLEAVREASALFTAETKAMVTFRTGSGPKPRAFLIAGPHMRWWSARTGRTQWGSLK